MSGLFPYVPAFLDLAGKPAVFLSGEAGMAPLARTLLEAGAGVTVIAAAISAELAALPVRTVRRRWRPIDLQRAVFVAAGRNEPRPGRARLAAKAARAVFYMEGAPALSDVSFGASVRHGALSIGVATPGLAAEVGETLARTFEQAVPPHYGGFLTAAAAIGPAIAERLDGAARAAFWRSAAADALVERGTDWEHWLLGRLPKG